MSAAGNTGMPPPRATGLTNRWSSSITPAAISARATVPPPATMMSPPLRALSSPTVSAGSPFATVAFRQGDSVRVREITTLGVLFIWSIEAWSSPSGPASHAGMKPSASLRPSTIVSTGFQMASA